VNALDNGGPAFPVADPFACNAPKTMAEALRIANGMTLRDYFAAKAMQGSLAGKTFDFEEIELEAKMAYEISDAMLKARQA